MKKMLIILCICSITLAGCSTRNPEKDPNNQQQPPDSPSQSDSYSGKITVADPEDDVQEPTKDKNNYQKVLTDLSVHRLDDFENPKELGADTLVTYYFMANYDGEGKLPIPEGFRQDDGSSLVFPAEEVEDFLIKLFDIDQDFLREAACYSEKGFQIPNLGLGQGSGLRVTKIDESNKNNVKVTFEVDAIITDAEGKTTTISPALRREIILDMTDSKKIKSLKTIYTAEMN